MFPIYKLVMIYELNLKSLILHFIPISFYLTHVDCCNLFILCGIIVKDGYRRHGHGEALLKAAIEKCRKRNICRISLHVDPERTPAVSLYKKMGFEIDAIIKCYYSSNRNAYRMYLDFQR
jgi:GNAT superfamily N-acetyltransferase